MLCRGDVICDDATLKSNLLSASRAKQLSSQTFKFSLGNSRTLLAGVRDFGSVEQEGFYLRLLDGPKFCLTTRLRDSSDCCGAQRRSSSNGAGEELFAAVLEDDTTGSLFGSSVSLDEAPGTTTGATAESMTP